LENGVTHNASLSIKVLYCQQDCGANSNLHKLPNFGQIKKKIKATNDDGRHKVISDNLKIDNGHLKKGRIQVA
jgi:hypothetical protein